MNDRLPGKPGRYSGVIDPADVQKLQKAEPFAITLTRDDEPIREGTPYSKATVLPDDVAKMLCPEKEDPTPADAFRHLGEGNLGANKDAFALFPFVIHENAYHGVDGNPVDKAGCSVYRLYLGDKNERLFGKTLQIKTYAYGDMAYGFEGEPGTKINPGADIVRDPQSGVCEFSVTLPEYDPENNVFFHISFCENPYTGFEMYEKKGTVWEEIKKLQSVEGYDAVESVATAIRYTPQALTEQQKAQTRENIGFSDAVAETIGSVGHQYNALINSASGDVISVTDSLDKKILGFNLHGKTIQNEQSKFESAGQNGNITVTITDGTEENVQTTTVSNDSELRGIQSDTKTSSMVYTTYVDENGKNWICDEIDFARGVRIKRLNIISIGDLEWKYSNTYKTFHALPDDLNRKCAYWVMCEGYTLALNIEAYKNAYDKVIANFTYLANGQDINIKDRDYTDPEVFREANSEKKILYILNEPKVERLTDEELAAYSALHTNKDGTSVMNDSGAGMSLGYVADTKKYIDNKFAELLNAILSAGANV